MHYKFFNIVNKFEFLDPNDKQDVLDSMRIHEKYLFNFKDHKFSLAYIECGKNVIALIKKELERKEYPLDKETKALILELKTLICKTYQCGLCSMHFSEPAWDNYLDFCKAFNLTDQIYSESDSTIVIPEAAGWIVTHSKELNISNGGVRSFVKRELRKNDKNLDLCKRWLDFELKLANTEDFENLADVLSYAKNHYLSEDFFNYAYTKIDEFLTLKKQIAKYIIKTFPSSEEATDAQCQLKVISIKTNEITGEQAYSAIEECHSLYKKEMRRYANLKIHNFYKGFLEELRELGLLNSPVFEHYLQVVDNKMLKNFLSEENYSFEAVENLIEIHWKKGNQHECITLFSDIIGNGGNTEDAVKLIKKVTDVVDSQEFGFFWEQGLRFETAFAITLRPQYLYDTYRYGGIDAARALALKRPDILFEVENPMFRRLIDIELEQSPLFIEKIRDCYHLTILNWPVKSADFIKYIRFEESQDNMAMAFSIYSYGIQVLFPTERLVLKVAFKPNEWMRSLSYQTNNGDSNRYVDMDDN